MNGQPTETDPDGNARATQSSTGPVPRSPPTPVGSAHGVLWRVLGLSVGIAAIVALAFLVARPRADPDPVAVSYTSTKGPRPPGLKIFLQRTSALTVLDPATELHQGDALRFVVRAPAPRYLVVRVRDGAGRERVLFPAAGAATAALVQPEQALPEALAIDATPGKETISALFATRPFPVATRAASDIETVTVDLMKGPAPAGP